MASAPLIVNDVTQLNPVPVFAIAAPTSVEEVQEALRRTRVPVSIGGGHFSMGGQTASPGSLHLDMRKLNRVLHFSPAQRTIRVQAGIRWCDIQKFLDPHDLSVKVMQTYANFTVGGALSVNCHGRYVGLGPVILSVREIVLVLVSGERVTASPAQNARLFYAAIGGYGAIGVIVEVELDLAENTRLERVDTKMPTAKYWTHFRETIRSSSTAVFHNGDIYPPHFSRVRSVTWFQTSKAVTVPHRLQPHRRHHWLERYFFWVMSEHRSGKWRREFVMDPLVYRRRIVHWRNYEAGYDVAELEPRSRKRRTYVLQEYFVPVERFGEFVRRMAEILQRHRVNMLNVSIRHAQGDPGSLLAWARGETFAFVLYYKQRTRENAKNRVAVWTRELIDAALSVGGTYYLPYQPHATPEQFIRAYPRAKELFALKRELDPEYRLRGVLWDKYYAPTISPPVPRRAPPATNGIADFHTVYSSDKWQDAFYRFLQNIYHLFPEDRFHTLIKEGCEKHSGDEGVYRYIQEHLASIRPALADFRYALPSLARQKREMTRQMLQVLGDRRDINGYIEIGTTGRYVRSLRRFLRLKGPVTIINDTAPTHSPTDIVERGSIRRVGRFVNMGTYEPVSPQAVPDASVDLVTCFIGLHHSSPANVAGFVRSVRRMLRPGGLFVLRDHDVTSPEMSAFVSLAHAVYNAGLRIPWEVNQREPRFFVSVAEWVRRLEAIGLRDAGFRVLQAHDPTDNTLMAFVKE
jgi:FAD/FMN-containing dehydrogenase